MRKRYRPFTWISLLLALYPSLYGQQLSFRYLGNDRGLNSLASWSCDIDQHGFLWLATSDGLVRFNGKEITYFFQQTHPEMPSDQVGYVYCDSRNFVWVCSDKGIVRIDDNRQFHRQIILEDKPVIDVDYCFEDGDGVIYAMTSRGAFSQKNGEEKWSPEHWLDSLVDGRGFRDIRRFDEDHYLIVFPSAGVMLINTKEKTQEVFIPVEGANCSTRFDEKSILIGAKNGFELIHVSLAQPSIQRRIEPPSFFQKNNLHENINYVVRAADGKVYLTTVGSGLVSLDSSLTTYTHYTHDPVNPSTIITNSLRFINSDSTGSLVITSLDGVNYTNVHNTSLEYVNYLKTIEGEIIDDRVISIAEDKDQNLWICTRDDVLIHDPVKNISRRIFMPADAGLQSSELAPMYVERDEYNNMWVGLRHQGIVIFNPSGGFKKYLSSRDYPGFGKSIDRPRVIREGHDGYVYIGTERGLFRISHQDYKLDSFATHPEMLALNRERIVDILPVENGIWVSSSPGGAAWHYSFSEKRLKFFDHKNGLPTNRIYGLAGERRGDIYVGSYGGFSIIGTNDSITNMRKGQGLLSPRIESIEIANDGSVWMTNNYSLFKYDPLTGTMNNLGGRHGLININFAVVSSVKLSSGKLAFGANKGLIIVDPNIIKFGMDSLEVFVFYHEGEGSEIEWKPGEKRTFKYTQSNIRFSFAVNDLMIADQVMFRYRLSSDDLAGWSDPSLNSSVDFNLRPGNYKLDVEANDGHEWLGLSEPVQFQIKPPWWKQWWFIAFIMLLVSGSIWLYFRGRIEKYRKELFVTRQIMELESKALRAQMNPHFVFNSLNAIQECIVTGKVEEAYTYLSKFSRLLRIVLEHSDRPEVQLQEELEVLELYISLEKLRFQNDMQYQFEIEEELDSEEILIPPMLIQPHIENAIWHGLRHKEGEKYLKLSISEKQTGYLEVIIEDNGIGRKKAEEMCQTRLGGNRHKSKGRLLSENRMDILQKTFPSTSMVINDLYNQQDIAMGTRVVLSVPILNNKMGGLK